MKRESTLAIVLGDPRGPALLAGVVHTQAPHIAVAGLATAIDQGSVSLRHPPVVGDSPSMAAPHPQAQPDLQGEAS